ncbi:hypothetical protein [Sphingobacterium sp. xlx-130]|uniref:hypothetical protein n=1 Tax=Sphingobacterium sp. xlx-130 TaxID=2654323 RepID=UPI0013DA5E84|nr:hypothetical protein [Sphingobacterium sp. xlx-130]
MDGLDLLKQHWNGDNNFPKIERNELQAMLHRSSSSIVKWIFIICCLEFALWLAISSMVPSEKQHFLVFQIIDVVYNVIFYAIIFYFIFQFYSLLVRIKTTNSTKKLMESILAVRKNAHRYIQFNLLAAYVAFGLALIQLIIEESLNRESWGEILFYALALAIIFTLFALLFIKIIKLYFRVLYGFLLKKLNKNYDELTRLEEDAN